MSKWMAAGCTVGHELTFYMLRHFKLQDVLQHQMMPEWYSSGEGPSLIAKTL